MNYISELLTELSSRLPELEWKVGSLSKAISPYNLPKGLFRSKMELTGAGCVAEIKTDIKALANEKNERSAHFLAERIKQKINVIVALCQMDAKRKKPLAKEHFGLSMLSTRQQWIQSMEQDISTLDQQQQAMSKAMQQMKHNGNTSAVLTLQAELGEVERRLTLAREAYNRAVN